MMRFVVYCKHEHVNIRLTCNKKKISNAYQLT